MPTFFWIKCTFKDVYAYISRLHYKTFHRLKYYFHAFTESEYYNRDVRKSSHHSSNVGIVDGILFVVLKNASANHRTANF